VSAAAGAAAQPTCLATTRRQPSRRCPRTPLRRALPPRTAGRSPLSCRAGWRWGTGATALAGAAIYAPELREVGQEAAGNPQLERLAQVCVQPASNSRAQGSKAVYEQHWRSLRWLEAFLLALRNEGWSDEAVLYAYRAFTSFLLGHLLLEAGARSAEDPAVDALPKDPLPPDAPNADTADPADRGVDVRQPDVATVAIAGAPLHDATADGLPVVPVVAAAVTVNEKQYPTVAEFAARLAKWSGPEVRGG